MIKQRQESGKTVIEIEGPMSKSTLEKVKKVISSTKQRPVGEEASKHEQIEEFLRRYEPFNVPVKDMRHIIPYLLMEVYVDIHGQYTKKVKGLWEKRPDDWPDTVPFADPNNPMKNESEMKNVKPNKELLDQMLIYLVDRYTKRKSLIAVSDCYLPNADGPLLTFPHQSTIQNDDHSPYELNLVETTASELQAAEQSVSDQSLSTGYSSGLASLPGYSQGVKPSLSSATNDGSIPCSLLTLEDQLNEGMDVEHEVLVEDEPDNCIGLLGTKQPDLDARSPEQVVDNEEETSPVNSWNSLEDICERTRRRLDCETMKLVPKGLCDQLENIHGILTNFTASVRDDNTTVKLIEKWLQLELCIETAKFRQFYKCSEMIQNLHDKLILKIVPSMNSIDNNTVKSNSMDLSVAEENSQQFNSLLNIKARPGSAGDRVPFLSGNKLEVRCLASEQSSSNNGRTLSDNHKPIQLAQEDGEEQKSEEPEFNQVTREVPSPVFDYDYWKEVLSHFNKEMSQLSQEMPHLSQEMSQLSQFLQLSQEMSCPVQESAPLTESTSQLAGKFDMPVDPYPPGMTNVSVQPWVSANPTVMSTPSTVFSSTPTVGPSQLVSNPSFPTTAFAEEGMSHLSLSVNRDLFPPPVQKANPCTPVQPLLDQLLWRPRAGGRSGGKRCCPIDEDDELDENVSGPSKPAKAPTYNTMIPLVVEEINNSLDKPFPRLLKKESKKPSMPWIF